MSPVPAMEPAAAREAASALAQRSAHRMLRAERAQLAHWRRLLRARLDLAVAGLAPPERLGVLTTDLLPEAAGALPDLDELRSAVTVPSIEDTVDLMNRIRRLDRALGRYAQQIETALEDSTRAHIRDLAGARPTTGPASGTPSAAVAEPV